MSDPDFIIHQSDLTNGGSLTTFAVNRIRQKLMAQGFVLLPSDTCYSLATYAFFDTTYENLNKVLDRGAEPISLACASYEEATSWMAHNTAALAILQNFTPGPITLVSRASDRIREHASFFEKVIKSEDQTIGLRVPDSIIERQVSETSDKYLITTAAVIDPDTNSGVRDFQRAHDLVKSGIERLGGAGWGAIEGHNFYARRSTVVKVNDDYSVEEIRAGDISIEDIKSVSDLMPSRYYDDRDNKMDREIERLVAQLKANVFTDSGEVEALEADLKNERIDGVEFRNRLREMQTDVLKSSVTVSNKPIQTEWDELSRVIEEKEKLFSRRAQQQFMIGTFGVPAGVGLSFLSLSAGYLFGIDLDTILIFAGAVLAALATHSYLILRVHQQASFAAERLAEKRVALLFLRLALGSTNERKSEELLSSGTSMFLGHQAAETLPLTSADLQRVKLESGGDG